MDTFDTSAMNPKHVRFCREYVLDFNATRATRAAGYSPNGAHATGYNMLQRLDCELYIEWLKEFEFKKIELSRESVIAQIGRMANHDPRKLIDEETGELKKVIDIDDDTIVGIGSKPADRAKALDMLAKHYNIYEDHQKSGTGEIHITIEGKDAQL